MANLFHEGLTWLADQLHDHGSRQVKYRRGAMWVNVQATLGRQLLSVTDRTGNTKVERTDRDFLVRAADLILGASVITPKRGDRVEVMFGSRTEIFEVMAPGQEPAWRYSDSQQVILRVHAKHIGTV